VLGGVAVAMVLAFAAARLLAARPDPSLNDPVEPGAGVALALTLSVAALLLWLLNPYAGLLAAPAAHLWMLAVLTRPVPRRRIRAAMIAIGLVPPLLVAVYYLVALSMDPLEGAWYLLMLVTGHSVGVATTLLACVMVAVLCGTIEIVARVPDEAEAERPAEPGPRVCGPGAHAGRGALGGTESALRW